MTVSFGYVGSDVWEAPAVHFGIFWNMAQRDTPVSTWRCIISQDQALRSAPKWDTEASGVWFSLLHMKAPVLIKCHEQQETQQPSIGTAKS